MLSKFVRTLALWAALYFALVVPTNTISALPPPKQEFSVSPLRNEVEVPAGASYSDELSIKNNGDTPISITMSAEGFNIDGQSYGYLFSPKSVESAWVSFDSSTSLLEPGESKTIHYTVGVPIGSEPRGYYVAMFATNTHEDVQATGITPIERVASLLYITVPGNSSRVGALIQINTPSVVFSEYNWSATVQNSGTLHYRSLYSVEVSTLFNQPIQRSTDSRLILPGSVRLIESTAAKPDFIGIYKAKFTIGLGDTPGQQVERWFLYLPPVQTALIILIMMSLFVLARTYRR